jgi:hypothetical protein
MLRRAFVIIAVLGFSCTAVLMAGSGHYFSQSDDTSWKSKDGDLHLRLGVTLYPQGLVRAFAAPERPAMPVLLETETVVPNQQFGIFLVFSGCREGDDGLCNTTVAYEIVLPDGRVAVRRDDMDVWHQPAPARGMPQLSEGVWVNPAEVLDPYGPHLIRAIVTDHVAGKTVELERFVTLQHPGGEVSRVQPAGSSK